MNAYELTELIINTMNRLDASWALFLSIHAALFGGIVYIDRPLRYSEKSVVICAYAVIAFYNYYLTRSSQKLLAGLFQDINNLQTQQELHLHTLDYFNQLNQSGWNWASHTFAIAVHTIAFIVVMIAVIMDGPIPLKK